MDKKKLLKAIKEEKELKLNSIMYDLKRESYVTASWTLSSLIELQGQEKILKQLED